MKSLIFVIIGSATGGLLRYGMANFFYHHLGREFSWGTLLVNWIGCFLIGLIFVLIVNLFHSHSALLHNLFLFQETHNGFNLNAAIIGSRSGK